MPPSAAVMSPVASAIIRRYMPSEKLDVAPCSVEDGELVLNDIGCEKRRKINSIVTDAWLGKTDVYTWAQQLFEIDETPSTSFLHPGSGEHPEGNSYDFWGAGETSRDRVVAAIRAAKEAAVDAATARIASLDLMVRVQTADAFDGRYADTLSMLLAISVLCGANHPVATKLSLLYLVILRHGFPVAVPEVTAGTLAWWDKALRLVDEEGLV